MRAGAGVSLCVLSPSAVRPLWWMVSRDTGAYLARDGGAAAVRPREVGHALTVIADAFRDDGIDQPRPVRILIHHQLTANHKRLHPPLLQPDICHRADQACLYLCAHGVPAF